MVEINTMDARIATLTKNISKEVWHDTDFFHLLCTTPLPSWKGAGLQGEPKLSGSRACILNHCTHCQPITHLCKSHSLSSRISLFCDFSDMSSRVSSSSPILSKK